MLEKNNIFRLSLESYNIVKKKWEGLTVTRVEEVIATYLNKADPKAVNLDEQLGPDN